MKCSVEYHHTMQIISKLNIYFLIIFFREELFENIKHASLDIPQYVSPLAKDIILRLLHRNPKKRLGTIGGADEIKKHPFFKNIDWTKLSHRAYRAPEPYLRKRLKTFYQ